MKDVTVNIGDSQVMGRLPVMVTSTVLSLTAISQVTEGLGSEVLTTFGGTWLNWFWFVCAMLSSVLVYAARLNANKRPQNSAILEIGGIALMDVVILTYALAVWDSVGFKGTLFALGLCLSVALNCSGRAVLLWRRRRWVEMVTRE